MSEDWWMAKEFQGCVGARIPRVTTFEVCNIVLNVVVAVLVIGYGIWLRNVVKHQIEAKDATIEAKDAEISRLRADTAPAIAEAYAKMRAHADQMTRDADQITRDNQTLKQQAENSFKSLPHVISLIELRTLEDIMNRMMNLTGKTIPPAIPLDAAFLETFKYVMDQAESRRLAYQKWASTQ